MIKIGFVGIPGTGKTTQARALSEVLAKKGLFSKIELVKEYARDYLSKHGSIEFLWEQYRILEKQIDWEETIIKSNADILITDSPIPLIFMYSVMAHNNDYKENMLLQDIFKKLLATNTPNRYDIVFYLPDVIKFDSSDKIRKPEQADLAWRKSNDEFTRLLFTIFKPKQFIELKTKSIEDRTNECIEYINTIL